MNPYLDHGDVVLYAGDALSVLRTLPNGCARTCITSPPYYGLRDYKCDGQIGLESSPEAYVAELVAVFRAVRRVLTDDGTLWLNIGDSYSRPANDKDVPFKRWGTAKPKDMLGIPWRVAFALQADGWYLRSDIIWAKPNPMPESVTDRPTKAHEYLFLLAKSQNYYYDADAVAEPAKDWSTGGPGTGIAQTDHYGAGNGGNSGLAKLAGRYKKTDAHPNRTVRGFNDRWDAAESTGADLSMRNRRTVWTIPTQPYPGAHFAVFPPALVAPCVLAGSAPGDIVLDPFVGSGTTPWVARANGRHAVGIDLNTEYLDLARDRLAQGSILNDCAGA